MADIVPDQMMPRRNPGLIQKIARAIVRADPEMGPQPSQQASTQSSVAADVTKTIWDKYFLTQNDRLAIYQDVEEMDHVSEEASVALDAIADNVCSSEDGTMESFRVFSNNPKVQAILDQVCIDCDLYQHAYTHVRNVLKFGDLFVEIVVNGEGRITRLKTLSPAAMFRNQDNMGHLLMGQPSYDSSGKNTNRQRECAYEQRDESTQEVVAGFYPWQILHARWNHDGISMFGRSMLIVSRISWKKIKAEEEALIMGRLIRAMMKLVFYVDTTGLSKNQKRNALQEFQRDILQRTQIDGKRENPFSVLTDFFLSVESYRMAGQVVESKTRIDVIDPKNDGLVQIDDIKHLHRKFLATLRIPPSYLGFEEQAGGKGMVSMQDIEFVRFLRRVQQFMSHNYCKIFDLALTLQGLDVNDEANAYEVNWPTLSTTDQAAAAAAEYQLAQSDALALGASSLNQQPYLSPQWILKHRHGLDDEAIVQVLKEVEEMQGQRLRQMAEVAKLNPPKGGNPAGAHEPPSPTDHTQRADPARGVNGSNTAERPKDKSNGHGNGSVQQEFISGLFEDALFPGKIASLVAQEVEPLIESVTIAQEENMRNAATLRESMVNRQQQDINMLLLDAVTNSKQNITLTIPPPEVPLVQFHEGSIQVPVNVAPSPAPNVEVHPPVVQAPHVEVHPPKVEVHPVQVEVHPPPVTVNVSPPEVNVAPTQTITVDPPDVHVHPATEPPLVPDELEILRDQHGRITGAKRKEKP